MQELRWDPSLETGHALVDEQHRSLFQAINDLKDAILSGKGMLEEKRTLAFLIDYTASHFRAEEDLMAQYGFPGLAVHRRLHQELLTRCRDLQAQQEARSFALQLDLFQFLSAWVTQHVAGPDREIVRYLQQKQADTLTLPS
jgi:hemerythrin-like metal-binding protein